MSNMVEKPEDMFSRDVTHFVAYIHVLTPVPRLADRFP